jgi:hypothetical protein
MYRAAVERPRTFATWAKHQHIVHPQGSTCVCDVQPGRFRKGQKQAGCGKTCYMCKPWKRAGFWRKFRTLKMVLEDMRLAEGLREHAAPDTAR